MLPPYVVTSREPRNLLTALMQGSVWASGYQVRSLGVMNTALSRAFSTKPRSVSSSCGRLIPAPAKQTSTWELRPSRQVAEIVSEE